MSVDATAPTAVIIGAGPAGLTAAHELLARTPLRPVVLESTEDVGGISRTIEYNGNRIDLGGHRFFSKSDRVMKWWLDVLPVQRLDEAAESFAITYRNTRRDCAAGGPAPDPATTDDVMLVRPRVSRILYGGQLFDYPLSLTPDTVRKLGLWTTARIGASYLRAAVAPIRPERSLEDFFINRFGRQLYRRFFEEYTEKVWGVPCREISPDWGAQRVKGLSITKVLTHAAKTLAGKTFGRRRGDLAQRDTETSLIERFLYPKLGPGQMWRRVADRVRQRGGEVRFGATVQGLTHANGKITGVRVQDGRTGRHETLKADMVFSTMPVRELVAGLDPAPPDAVRTVSGGLLYRDFLTVGLLVDRLRLGGGAVAATLRQQVPDNWIYIQEPGVRVGRVQIFNNWSPWLVANPDKIWIGLEYFCNVDDEVWSMADPALIDFAIGEVEKIGLLDRTAVRDGMVTRMPKAYPAYFGTFDRFDTVRDYVDSFDNLFLIGRNGMHHYNNQDHSMLAAMTAVDNLATGRTDKANLWAVNAEQDYHEGK